MIDPQQFRDLVICPSLQSIGLWSQSAEQLLLATAIAESGLRSLKQIAGPALSVYQIEPATHDDIWVNFLRSQKELAGYVRRLRLRSWHPRLVDQLVLNLAYATAMARLVYYRRPEPLPKAGDLVGMAEYWKAHYNTVEGAGTVEGFLRRVDPVFERIGL